MAGKNSGKYFLVEVGAAKPGLKTGILQHQVGFVTGSAENRGGTRPAWIPASMAVPTAVALLEHYKCPADIVAAIAKWRNNGKASIAPAVPVAVAADDSDDSLI